MKSLEDIDVPLSETDPKLDLAQYTTEQLTITKLSFLDALRILDDELLRRDLQGIQK